VRSLVPEARRDGSATLHLRLGKSMRILFHGSRSLFCPQTPRLIWRSEQRHRAASTEPRCHLIGEDRDAATLVLHS